MKNRDSIIVKTMGIRHLNRYLRTNCPNSIRCINLADLSGKVIAVDISIYLYKYETDNVLLENIYLMLAIFRHYNIIPIFIFDGKPPPEKKELLIKRKIDRENAQEEYDILKSRLADNDDSDDKQEIIASMDQLKKQFVQINKEKIDTVKRLIRAYGATYYDAPGEADELCALLAIKKKVWACLSEDMDLFVYGCTRVLRYFSLIGHTAVLYYTRGILKELQMTQTEFKEVCILSGTDYNIKFNNTVSLNQSLKHFQIYKQSLIDCLEPTTYYEWLLQNTNYISDIDNLKKINNMFNLDTDYHHRKLDIFQNIAIMNSDKNQTEIETIMLDADFIFVKS
jgi:5'-3' exonuclease